MLGFVYMRSLIPAAIAGAVTAGTVLYGIHAPSSQVFGPSAYRGRGRRRSIALTFDDGPSEDTLKLLSYLADEGVKATFFQCGMNVDRLPAIAQRVAEAGHEIGNHTYSHIRLCPRIGWQTNMRSSAEIYNEFARTQVSIQSATGVIPKFLRAPYGLRWVGLRCAQRRLHLKGVMWTVIGRDWEWRAPEVSELVLRRSSPGGIICLHDGRDIQQKPDLREMLLAVQQIVPSLKAKGYSFETVSELLA